MKDFQFKAEDGATFHGSVKKMDNGYYEASCYAQQHVGGDFRAESRVYEWLPTEARAHEWLRQTATARGFSEVMPE